MEISSSRETKTHNTSGRIDIDKARAHSRYKDEMFGRRVAIILKEKGVTPEELAIRCPRVPHISQLVQGEPPCPIRREWKEDIARALGLLENRGRPEDLSDDELDVLFQPKSGWQIEMPPDDSG